MQPPRARMHRALCCLPSPHVCPNRGSHPLCVLLFLGSDLMCSRFCSFTALGQGEAAILCCSIRAWCVRAAALRGAKVSFSSTPSSLPQILPIERAPCILFDSSDGVEREISFTRASSFLGWGMCGIDAEIRGGCRGFVLLSFAHHNIRSFIGLQV